MITKITPVEELKQIFLEIFLNKTDKVSDVSDDSVLNAIAYGNAKLTQRTLNTWIIWLLFAVLLRVSAQLAVLLMYA